MAEEKEKGAEARRGGDALDAVAAGAAGGGRDARIAELERELQTQRVEAGRLRKASEENAALRKRLRELEERAGEDDAMRAVPADLEDSVPEDFRRTSAAISRKVAEDVNRESSERIASLERQVLASRKRDVESRLSREFPGFLRDIQPGGDKEAAWAEYLRNNRESVAGVMKELDYGRMKYHVQRFYRDIGASPEGGAGGAAAPDPRPEGGRAPLAPDAPGKRYTAEEYARGLRESQALFQSHRISAREYADARDRLNRAYREGRVTP